jgi:multicomponent Na+:H+ antiporter subunit E
MTASIFRTAGFLGFWLILTGFKTTDIPVGLLASVIAGRASLHLLPPGQWHLRPFALARLALRFLHQSLVAGIDVSCRALDPRLPLQPGFVVHPSRLPPGSVRSTFCMITSLLPGTLPCGTDESGGIVIHCLDVGQPVVSQMTTEEEFLIETLGGLRGHG